MNDSMQVKAPVVPILPLCRWHWICPWQAGMVVCHIYTAWLRMWSGKLKESLKQEQSYLFKSQEEEYAFFPEREICANKKTDWSCLKVSHNCGVENTNPLFWSRSLINFVLRLWLCKLIFSTICAYVWVFCGFCYLPWFSHVHGHWCIIRCQAVCWHDFTVSVLLFLCLNLCCLYKCFCCMVHYFQIFLIW